MYVRASILCTVVLVNIFVSDALASESIRHTESSIAYLFAGGGVVAVTQINVLQCHQFTSRGPKKIRSLLIV